MGDTDTPKVSGLLRTVVCCLKEKLALFEYCTEEALASERELVHALFDIDSAEHKSTSKNVLENDSLKAAESNFTFFLGRIF